MTTSKKNQKSCFSRFGRVRRGLSRAWISDVMTSLLHAVSSLGSEFNSTQLFIGIITALVFGFVIYVQLNCMIPFHEPPHYLSKAYFLAAYYLKISLTENFNKNDWTNINNISDLVSTKDFPFTPLFSRESSKTQFLQKKLSSAMSNLSKRSTQWRLNFYFSLLELQNRNIMPVQSLMAEVDLHLIETLSTSISIIKEKSKLFLEGYTQMQRNIIPPISNLTKYLDKRNCILAEPFLADFLVQMTTNLGEVDKIDFVSSMKPFLVNITLITKSCVKFGYDVGADNAVKLKEILSLLQEMKMIFKDNIEFMQTRYEQVENSLIHLSIDCFKNKPAITYFNNHEAALSEAFLNVPKNFPFKVPNIMSQSENLIQIRNDSEYQKVKNTYIHISILASKFKKMMSIPWPAMDVLPNFSTHDLAPRLSCGTPEDFESILSLYSEYLKRLELLKQNWSTSLRSIVNTTEPLELKFEKVSSEI